MSQPHVISYLPPGLETVEGEWKKTSRGGVTARGFYPTPQGLKTLAEGLRARQHKAKGITSAERIATFDALASVWLDPNNSMRQRLVSAISHWTGFSPAMVAHAIDLEQRSSRRDHLERALTQELGSVGCLDAFTPNRLLGGRSRAIGPALVGAVCSANIPALPHLEVMRSLLVKGACLTKAPSGEPLFLAAYARTLAELHPALGSTVAVVSIDRGDNAAQGALAGAVDHLVVYGGLAAIKAWQIAANTPEGSRPHKATWHGHKLGVAIVADGPMDPGELAQATQALAYDFSLYDREACLSPAMVYVVGTPERGREVASAIADAMEQWATQLPPGEAPVAAVTARRRWLDGQIIGGSEIVTAPPGLPFIVTLDPNASFGPSAPGRVVRVATVPTAGLALAHLAPLSDYLQCAAVSGPPDACAQLAEALAELGASRITRPGLMGLPSMMWRHDGGPCLSGLVRFCDEEWLAPEANGPVPLTKE